MLWKYEPLRNRWSKIVALTFVMLVSQWTFMGLQMDGHADALLLTAKADSGDPESEQIALGKEAHDDVSEVSSGNHELTNSQKIYEVVATGYYAGVESTGKQPEHPEYGITYSGVKVRRGIVSTIAADLNVFPIGTVLYIPGYGYGVVADIGGAVKGRVIDLYFPSLEEVFSQWGKRTVQVTVIEEGDGRLDEAKLLELERMLQGRSEPPSAL